MTTRYSVSTLPNPGHDPEFPVLDFPFLVFIRDLFNPINSSWTFCHTEAEARQKETELVSLM